ncbi:hypothetical protein [Mucilaginibacter sp.]
MKLFTRYNRISLPIILGIFILSGFGCYTWIKHMLINDFDDSLSEQAQKINDYTVKTGKFPEPGLTEHWVIQPENSRTIIRPYFKTIRRYDPDDNDNSRFRSINYSCDKDGKYYRITVFKSMEAMEGLSRSIALITMVTLLAVIIVTLF